MSPNTHIIDMSKEALEDLNDALEDEGLDIEFGVDDGFAFYRILGGPGGSTARTRVEPFTKASECWKIARDLFRPVSSMTSSPSASWPQALEAEQARLKALKRNAKFMSPEWRHLNRQAAAISRAAETAWREYYSEVHKKMTNNR